MGILSWWFVDEEAWLSRRAISHVLDVVEGRDVEDSPGGSKAAAAADAPKAPLAAARTAQSDE